MITSTLIEADKVLSDIGRRLTPLKTWLEQQPEGNHFIIINRGCPSGKGRTRNVINVYKRVIAEGEDVPFDRAWGRYQNGDVKFKDLHMK